VRGRKLTSLSEDYWEEVDGKLVMPPPFALEALCQAGTWLVMISTDRRKRAALLSIGSVEFLGDVHPGDVLELDGTVESMSDEVAVVSGRVTSDGRPILEAKDIMCTLIDAGDLADLDDTHRLQKMLTRSES
jgi:3-hydroxyacyl-[acyl-carrier-protein] dehydratase